MNELARLLSSVAIAGLLMVGTAFASIDEARKARLAGNFATAWELLTPLAQRGDLTAMVELGDLMVMSSLPDGRERGIRFYRAAAERGSVVAAQRLKNIEARYGEKAVVIPPGVSYQKFLAGRNDLSPEQIRGLLSREYTPADSDFPPDLAEPSEPAGNALAHVVILVDAYTPLTDSVFNLEGLYAGKVTFEWIATVKQPASRGGRAPRAITADPSGHTLSMFKAKAVPIAVLIDRRSPNELKLTPLGSLPSAIAQIVAGR